MLRLILGPAGSGKTSMISKEIAEKISGGEGNIYMIVPEQYSHEAERELCMVCGDSLSLGAEVLSFSRLAVRVAQEAGSGGKTYLDTGGRLLCMSLAVKQIVSRLKIFGGARRNAKLQLEILKAVEELKNACVPPEALLAAAESCPGQLGAKLWDLALCFEAYDAILAQGHADPADRLIRLRETIAETAKAKDWQIYIDGFTDFTSAEHEVLEALIAADIPVSICLTCDSLQVDSEHFHHARIAGNGLLRFAEKESIKTQILTCEADTGKAAALRFYEEYLFRYTLEAFEDKDDSLKIFHAADIRGECENAAALCLELVRKTGCRWRDIAIAARGFDDYSTWLSDIFSLYGVPVFSARRDSIMQKPVPALISAAFDVISGGWDLPEVLTYIKTGLTGISRADCDKLESYAVLWDISGSAWHRSAPWKQHPAGFGREETEESKRLLAEIDGIRRRLSAPLIRLGERGKASVSALNQVRGLSNFLTDISLPETLEKHSEELDRADKSQLANEFSQLWGVLCRAMEQFAALLGESPMDQEEFSELFLKMLSQYDVASIPLSPDSVTAGEIDRMRRRHIKHLIFLGASDDRLPSVRESSGLLSESDREALERLGVFRPGEQDKLQREFSLIYNCVTLPSESLTLSYSDLEGDGAKARPSFLIARARALLGTEICHVETDLARLSAPEPAFLLASGFEKGAGVPTRLAYEYFFSRDTGRARLEALRERAELERNSISREVVQALYGSTVRISPSRADRFFSCRFYYFLCYGLKLNDREKAGFNPPELGTYMHYVLEKCSSEIAATVGFKNATPELSAALADKYTDLYITESLGGFEDKSPRFVFLFNRLRPSVERVVTDMVRELSRSDFVPLRFELSFGLGGDLPPIRLAEGENELFINGTVDRIDGCFRDGKLYLRVVDYKTGKASFSLSDTWYGLGMQMLLYLFSLERSGNELFNGEIVPAGVLYVPARDALVSSRTDLTDEKLAAEKAKELRRSGLLLNSKAILQAMEYGDSPEYIPVKYKDGEPVASDSLADENQLSALRGHVDRRLLELGSELSQGRIDPQPCYKSENDNACNFCPYGRICRFDGSRNKRRYMGKISAEEFWKQVGGGQNGCD